jgi:hypothetical protein
MKSLILAALMTFAVNAQAATIALNPPADPTKLLNMNCGGIHVDTYILQFDDNTGNIVGKMDAWTKCGRRVIGGYKWTVYRNWYDISWDAMGALLTYTSSTDGAGADINTTDCSVNYDPNIVPVSVACYQSGGNFIYNTYTPSGTVIGTLITQ